MKILYIGKRDVLIDKLQFYLPEMIIDRCDEFWEGIELAQSGMYCVVIINIACPEWSLGLLRLRRSSDVSVAVLTDRYRLDEKMKVFGFGANDYITGIKDIIGLSARVAKYQHTLCEMENPDKTDDVKEFTIDIGGKKLYHNGKYVRLTKKEFHLFYMLFSHCGNALSHAQLGGYLYGEKFDAKKNGKVMYNVFAIRSKVEEDAGMPQHVRTIMGEGYMLNDADKFLLI